MKVNEIINTHFKLANSNISFLVKPNGTEKIYYSGDGNYIRNEVAEMEVKRWLIDDSKKKNLIFVVLVERDENFEKIKNKNFEN